MKLSEYKEAAKKLNVFCIEAGMEMIKRQCPKATDEDIFKCYIVNKISEALHKEYIGAIEELGRNLVYPNPKFVSGAVDIRNRACPNKQERLFMVDGGEHIVPPSTSRLQKDILLKMNQVRPKESLIKEGLIR